MIRIFRVLIPTSVIVLILSDAILISGCYLAAAFLALNVLIDPWFYLRYEDGWLQILFVVAILQTGLYLMDLYNDLWLRSRILLIQQLCFLLGVVFLVQAMVGYTKIELLQLPQWTMVYGSVFVLIAIPTWRHIFFSLVRKALPNNKLMFLGLSPSGQEIIEHLADHPDMGFSVVGYLGTENSFPSGTYLGSVDSMDKAVNQYRPDMVIVDQQKNAPGWPSLQRLLDLRLEGVKIEETGQLYEMIFGRVSLRDLQPSQILFSRDLGPRSWTVGLQSLYSLLLGLVGLILAFPIMILVFLIVKISSPGPAFYSQKRMGKNNTPFSLYKFRSMYVDAEARTGPVWATKNDPRITPVGRWLRKLRLDELPQFFNVIRGEMAVVGPRPERPEFCALLEEKIPFYSQRHLVKPGITGWAQINHKYTETVEDTSTKLEYDLYYVKHLAPALDFYIIFHTLKVMVLFRGAQ
jgi:exopolysaccharide biosynthesis polyprenyl glycosylphosphotransferase